MHCSHLAPYVAAVRLGELLREAERNHDADLVPGSRPALPSIRAAARRVAQLWAVRVAPGTSGA